MKKQRKINNNSGITLIALIVTIIVLLILAGVTINLAIKDNGIFKRVANAATAYNNAEQKEDQAMKDVASEIDKYAGLYESDSLPENTKDTKQGTLVKLKDGWGAQTVSYVATSGNNKGKEVSIADKQKVATVYAVSVGNGDTVPVPYGFYYVGGDLSLGVIISDNSQDAYDEKTDKTTYDYRKSLVGNQFVWIPCTSENYVKITSYTANANYDKFPNSGERAQIEKYGGFYVGRYEAGLEANTSGFNDSTIKGKVSVVTDKYGHSWGWQSYTFTTTSGKPVSKAGLVPWYHADYSTAFNVAENMYKGNSYVNSGLLTGTMWDQMIAKIGDANAKDKGNYYDSSYSTGTLLHSTVDSSGNSSAWTTTSTTKSASSYMILETGSTASYERYHVYDTAGNLWEWTNEVSYVASVKYNNDDSLSSYMLRGGSFNNASTSFPASYRAYNAAGYPGTNDGFRVALYLK